MKQQHSWRLKAVAVAAALAASPAGLVWAQAAAPTGTLNLEEVVVTGTATRNSKMKQSVSISSIGTEAMEMAAPGNAAEVLRSIPGIRAESTGGEGNANINVRGLPSPDGGARYAQFQEDGLPVMLFGDIMFGTADGIVRADSNVDRLEVVRGGSASTFTSNAPGAILNFISKTGEEKGGAIGITKGLNFDRTRYDVDYGGPLSDTTRFHIGGYFRQGEGVRSAGNNAENGGQVRANVTHDLGKGSFVRLNFKAIDDQVPMFLPTPMQRNGTTFTAFPGFDPMTGFSMPKGLVDVAFNQAGQKVVTDTATGSHMKSTSFGGEVLLNLENGWKLNDKFRVSSTSGSWVGMTSPNDVGTAGALAIKYGGAGATATYRSNGASATNDTAFVGHLFNVKVNDLGNTVNDLKLSKSSTVDGAKLDTTFGLFTMNQKIAMDWQWSSYLLSMSGTNPRIIDIKQGGTSINALGGTGFGNGAAAWGNCCVTSYSLSYTQTAPYAAVAWEKDNLNVDGSVRLDNLRASGSAPWGGQALNYSLTKPAVSVGANYRIDNNLSAFGRISHGTRFNADRVAGSKAVNGVTGASANDNALFDTVDQYEVGAKMRNGNLSLFSTLFAAKTRITSFDPTATPQELADNYDAKGIELEAGYRMGNLRIAAGATYTDAKIVSSGKVPQRQAKFVYQIAPTYTMGDLTLGGSIQGTSSSYANNANTFVMPGYVVTNLFVGYSLDKRTNLSVSVNNLFNTLGISEIQDVAATYFSPRTTTGRAIQASLKYAF
jgi:outer membrane receptor protein involved in Fe transport